MKARALEFPRRLFFNTHKLLVRDSAECLPTGRQARIPRIHRRTLRLLSAESKLA